MRVIIYVISILICLSTTAQETTKDRIEISELKVGDCFSSIRQDSTYTNFYLKEKEDTVFYNYSGCSNRIILRSPIQFKRYTRNGLANGNLVFFENDVGISTLITAEFIQGEIVSGTQLQKYRNDTIYCLGEFNNYKRVGKWYWYHPNGNIDTVVTYNNKGPLQLLKYSKTGELIDVENFIQR